MNRYIVGLALALIGASAQAQQIDPCNTFEYYVENLEKNFGEKISERLGVTDPTPQMIAGQAYMFKSKYSWTLILKRMDANIACVVLSGTFPGGKPGDFKKEETL